MTLSANATSEARTNEILSCNIYCTMQCIDIEISSMQEKLLDSSIRYYENKPAVTGVLDVGDGR